LLEVLGNLQRDTRRPVTICCASYQYSLVVF